MTYSITDPSEHDDLHRGFIRLDGLELNITITHEGLIVDLYDDTQGDLIGTFTNTFTELAEMLQGGHPVTAAANLRPPAARHSDRQSSKERKL